VRGTSRARPWYPWRVSSPELPTDLLPLREAATASDRSVSTLRGWVRSGQLRAYRPDGADPRNTPALVSLGELRALLVTSGAASDPPRPPPAPPAALREEAHAAALELVELRAALAIARAEAEGTRREAAALHTALRVAEERVTDLTATVELERARVAAAEAEVAALRASAGLPWWRRLLPG
jgi:hypothetical protein